MPKLIAKEKFFYAGRNVAADEEFEAEAQDVALLTDSVSPRARLPDVGAASSDTGLFERKDEKPVADGTEQPGRSGRYKRRDMRAKE